MSEPAAAGKPDIGKAFVIYTGLRLGIFGICFLVACSIVLPSTDGPKASRVLICALIAAVASVPLSLYFGRSARSRLTAALLAGREARDAQDREYDERVRAVRDRQRLEQSGDGRG